MLELAFFTRVFATGLEDPLENFYCFRWMLCRRNIPMRKPGFYESKCPFQRDGHFRADQRFRQKLCFENFRGRDRRVLYDSGLEAEP